MSDGVERAMREAVDRAGPGVVRTRGRAATQNTYKERGAVVTSPDAE